MTEVTYYVALPFIVADGCGWRADRMLLSQRGCNARRSVPAQGRAVTESSVALPPDVAEQHMLDTQNQGPQCTACGSPMKLAAIEPSMWGKDLRTFACRGSISFRAPDWAGAISRLKFQ